MISIKRITLGFGFFLMLVTAGGVKGQGFHPYLIDQLLELAEEHNFVIRGIDETEGIPGHKSHGDVESKIDQLLNNFNYLLIRTEQGNIEKIILLKEKTSGPKKIVLSTRRTGRHHVLKVSIKGLSNEWITLDLMVDTGADFIVLPNSLMGVLGYSEENLEVRKLQTANGLVDAQTGKLEAIEFGHEIIPDAMVAFVQDALLGGHMLLGMDVIKRYKFTIDDDARQITLIKKWE